MRLSTKIFDAASNSGRCFSSTFIKIILSNTFIYCLNLQVSAVWKLSRSIFRSQIIIDELETITSLLDILVNISNRSLLNLMTTYQLLLLFTYRIVIVIIDKEFLQQSFVLDVISFMPPQELITCCIVSYVPAIKIIIVISYN